MNHQTVKSSVFPIMLIFCTQLLSACSSSVYPDAKNDSPNSTSTVSNTDRAEAELLSTDAATPTSTNPVESPNNAGIDTINGTQNASPGSDR